MSQEISSQEQNPANIPLSNDFITEDSEALESELNSGPQMFQSQDQNLIQESKAVPCNKDKAKRHRDWVPTQEYRMLRQQRRRARQTRRVRWHSLSQMASTSNFVEPRAMLEHNLALQNCGSSIRRDILLQPPRLPELQQFNEQPSLIIEKQQFDQPRLMEPTSMIDQPQSITAISDSCSPGEIMISQLTQTSIIGVGNFHMRLDSNAISKLVMVTPSQELPCSKRVNIISNIQLQPPYHNVHTFSQRGEENMRVSEDTDTDSIISSSPLHKPLSQGGANGVEKPVLSHPHPASSSSTSDDYCHQIGKFVRDLHSDFSVEMRASYKHQIDDNKHFSQECEKTLQKLRDRLRLTTSFREAAESNAVNTELIQQLSITERKLQDDIEIAESFHECYNHMISKLSALNLT